MSSDQTQHQSLDDQQKARELSLEGAQPPAQIPGYKLRNYIGSGAFGEVWSAVQLKTGRRVAIKYYTRRSNTDVQMMAQEVEKLVALTADARYVVQLLDVGFDAVPPYYVMDYIEGGSLEDLMKNGNILPTAQALDLFQEIATGMMLLHGKGILHCDLKPGNVLLDQDGKPRVADFGQSRLSTDETPALGTLFYMAPEQADLKAIPDAGWDVYGLGALLYCMLTGKPPYYSPELANEIEATEKIGERLESYRKALVNAPTPQRHRQVPGVDRMLADLIDKCIAADPKKRFNSVESLMLALRQRQLVHARRPLMLLGLIGPLLLMLVMSLFGWWAFRQAVVETDRAVLGKAEDSNRFAAELAAQSAGIQLEEYFKVVMQLAEDESFLVLFDRLMKDTELEKKRISLADPNKNFNKQGGFDQTTSANREFLKKSKLCTDLIEPLTKRIENVKREFPASASWFVCDRFGNQIASAFDTQGENTTLGNNYSFRTYFTGLDEDKNKESLALNESEGNLDVLNSRQIIGIGDDGTINRQPVLSAAFSSEQSNNWKVAFSAPIVRKGEVQGIVAVTVDLGNLIELAANVIAAQTKEKNSTADVQAQYVMLVDGRNPENSGVILEHPLFNKIIENGAKLSTEVATMPIDLEKAKTSKWFIDPLGETDIGKRNYYGSVSIVSIVDVQVEKTIPGEMTGSQVASEIGRPTGSRARTGLSVLAVQDRGHILADVQQLESNLGKMAIFALLMLMCVSAGMWIFVNRMMKESRERLTGAFAFTNDSATSQDQGLGMATAKKIATQRPPTSRSQN